MILETCTLWSTLKIPEVLSAPYNAGHDISRATKTMTKATLILKATLISKVSLSTMRLKVTFATL
jgi:hypothetical protein